MPATYKPSNPVVIIGLGGTGQWVLTYIKKNLIETWGAVPDSVRLLAIDTTGDDSDSQKKAGIQNSDLDGNPHEEEKAQVGNVKLDRGEFEYFKGDLYPYAVGLRDHPKNYPHMLNWFQAEWYLRNLPRGQFQLESGAGKLRQFGRMGVFLDLAQGQPKAIGRIQNAINDVKNAQGTGGMIHIFIVASLVGGTGAGMFIDLAHIVRKVAGDKDKFRLHGFLALHNTFQQVLGNDDYSRVYAAIRELHRFQQVIEEKYPIYYVNPADPAAPSSPKELYRGISNHKIFDYCYLMDGSRNTAPLDGVKPWHGVYPTMAECITMALDPETSKTYFDSAINQSADSATIQEKTKKAIYYSLGTYTYILPVQDIIEKATYKMVKELLGERLVKVEVEEETGREYASWDAAQNGLAAPVDEVRTFLKTDAMPTPKGPVKNCAFVKQMGVEFDQGPFNNPQRLQFMAEQNELLLSWLNPLAPNDPNSDALLVNAFQERLAGVIPNGEAMNEPPDGAPGRIQEMVRDYRAKKLGTAVRGAAGANMEVPKGLTSRREANRTQFTEFLKARLLELLNGSVGEDPLTAKSGKLAYARDFLEALIGLFNQYEDYLKSLVKYRADTGYIAQGEQGVEATRTQMLSTVDPNFWQKLQKVPTKAQDAFILAEDFLYYTQRNDLLYQALVDQNSDLRGLAQNFKRQIDEWLAVLVLGGVVGPKESKEDGILQEVRRLENELDTRRSDDKEIKVFEYLTNKDYEDKLYKQYTPAEKWQIVLGRLTWDMAAGPNGPELKYVLGGHRPQDAKEEFYLHPKPLENATAHNRIMLTNKLRGYFEDISQNETVIERMQELKGQGAVRELLTSSAPLIKYAANMQGGAKTVNYICVNPGPDTVRPYHDLLRDILNGQARAPGDADVIRLTNPHRCIMLTAAYHLIGEELDAVKEVRNQYINSFSDIEKLKIRHNFPAEVTAVKYEKAITRPPVAQPLRLLQPLVVSLLDDEERFRLFVRAWVFDLIRREEVGSGATLRRYALRLDRLNKREDSGSYLTLTADINDPKLEDALKRFIFSDFDDDGNRLLLNYAGNFSILPAKVETALALRLEAIRTGRDQIAAAVRALLDKERALLVEPRRAEATPNAVEVLTGAMRVFMHKRQNLVSRGELADLITEIKELVLEGNLDWLDETPKYQDQLAQMLAQAVVDNRGKLYGGDRLDMIIRRMEKAMDREVEDLKADADPVLKDAGCVMQIMLYEEINQLSKMMNE